MNLKKGGCFYYFSKKVELGIIKEDYLVFLKLFNKIINLHYKYKYMEILSIIWKLNCNYKLSNLKIYLNS